MILSEIFKEYPSLRNGKILKRFVSVNGREYNTYLIECGEKYVAKCTVLEQYSVSYEYLALKRLVGRFNFAPSLVFDDIVPSDVLLLHFIDGFSLSEMDVDIGKFKRIGEILAELHSVSVEKFGRFDKEGIDWIEYIEHKIFGSLHSNINLLPEGLIEKVDSFYLNLKDLLIADSKRGPVFIHRDIYLENFIFDKSKNEIVLLDYAMAFGGRPIYDFAKFFMLHLCDDPKKLEAVCHGYYGKKLIPADFLGLLRLYLLTELSGMINFLNSMNKQGKVVGFVLLLQRLVDGDLI